MLQTGHQSGPVLAFFKLCFIITYRAPFALATVQVAFCLLISFRTVHLAQVQEWGQQLGELAHAAVHTFLCLNKVDHA